VKHIAIVIELFLTSYAVVSVLCLTVNDEKLSEKTHEQCRASKATKVVAKHRPDFGTKQAVLQKLFLTNITNKQNFFTIISSEFNWHCGNWH